MILILIGKELEESGVLGESVRSRKDFWGLHMPLVCPDGAVVAYAWKRQLAGQAGASAVDRTRFVLVQLVLCHHCLRFKFSLRSWFIWTNGVLNRMKNNGMNHILFYSMHYVKNRKDREGNGGIGCP